MNININKEKIKNKALKTIDTVGRGAMYGCVAMIFSISVSAAAVIGDAIHAEHVTANMSPIEKYDHFAAGNHPAYRAITRIDYGTDIPVPKFSVDVKSISKVVNDGAKIDNLLYVEDKIIETIIYGGKVGERGISAEERAAHFAKAWAAENEVSRQVGDKAVVVGYNDDGKMVRLMRLKERVQASLDFTYELMDEALNEISSGGAEITPAQQENYNQLVAQAESLSTMVNFIHANDKTSARMELTLADGQLTSEQKNNPAQARARGVDSNDRAKQQSSRAAQER